MDIASEVAGRSVSVTIKTGKGYEAAWFNFRGLPAEVRADILLTFGMDDNAELTLHDIAHNAEIAAHRLSKLGEKLDATVIPTADAGPPFVPDPPKASSSDSDDPWAGAPSPGGNAAADADPLAPLYAAVEASADVASLKELWSKNQAAFADAALMDAYKAKGKALKAAAA